MSLLELRDIEVVYQRRDRPPLRAVAGATLSVGPGEIVGLVGETGCGKSSLARAAVGLVTPASGEVLFEGKRLHPLRGGARDRRETRLQMVFQNPYSSLNPRRKVGSQIADALSIQGVGSRHQRRRRVAEMLDRVGLPATAADRYPHQYSGGQRQRIAIARALAAQPSVIVLDEPLSALDASVQAQVANLLAELARELGVGMLLISHDLAIVRHVAHRTAVMYLGLVVEAAPTRQLWSLPLHPYTEALINSIPHADGSGELPVSLAGEIPDPGRPPAGCRFHPRCPYAFDRCHLESPPLIQAGRGRHVACWLQEVGSAPARPSEKSAAQAVATRSEG